MSIKEKILSFISIIGAFLAAIFYVLFQQKKNENLQEKNENLQKENEKLQNEIDDAQKVTAEYNQNLAATEEQFHNAVHGDVDAGIQLMHNLSENGKKRNKSAEK